MGRSEERLAEFIVNTKSEDIPDDAYRAAREAIFDCIGVMLAGADQPLGKMIQKFVSDQGGAGDCTIVGSSMRTSQYMAALGNGTLGHALDYDDMGGFGHPSVALLPPALAIAEELDLTVKDLLTAYVIGFEAAAHLSRGSSSPQGTTGFHSTAIFGTMGAAAVAARLLGLDKEQTLTALGMAGSMPSGILQNFGTYTKPLHAGMTSRNGIMAGYLAKDGWKATDNFLESKVGWASAYLGAGNFDPQAMVNELGKTWLCATSIVIKKYPCCGSNHSSLDSLLSILNTNELDLNDIDEVEIDNFSSISHVLLYPRPTYGFQGKFSIHYNVATALVDKKIDMASFNDENLDRAEYTEAVEKVDIKIKSEWDSGRDGMMVSNPVKITLKDGTTLEEDTNRHVMRGTQANPLSEEEFKDKFYNCAILSLPKERVGSAIDSWWNADGSSKIRDLLGAIRID
tara:strand:+ start:109 stop:1476 length:1368 start_codon:yes stop_codon:yes gene_type:complete